MSTQNPDTGTNPGDNSYEPRVLTFDDLYHSTGLQAFTPGTIIRIDAQDHRAAGEQADRVEALLEAAIRGIMPPGDPFVETNALSITDHLRPTSMKVGHFENYRFLVVDPKEGEIVKIKRRISNAPAIGLILLADMVVNGKGNVGTAMVERTYTATTTERYAPRGGKRSNDPYRMIARMTSDRGKRITRENWQRVLDESRVMANILLAYALDYPFQGGSPGLVQQ